MPDNMSKHAKRQSARKTEIVKAATEIFFREGYGRASMDQVHSVVGGSKRTLYKHFSSKDELFIAIIERVSDRVLQVMVPEEIEGELENVLLTIGESYLKVILSKDGLSLFRAMISEATHFPTLAKQFYEHGPGKVSSELAKFFRTKQKQGEMNGGDARAAAEQFLGMLRGDVHLTALLYGQKPRGASIVNHVECVVTSFLKSYGGNDKK
ncbi:HTH-type transcriptional regulator MtrR [Poriferisphaera corsica]|uniref:HTH-type transcriptional regulator MtrR n=1 Tax=Poriferisphaera corsica TaxID=2528020 RepID=A0A517YW30_9BACT|nr:TetR/AcrR family transcriptional regulator [Poriferisphaera corsica]QDU34434.1 HTH-type transcriptional regulator MtrR [Poriferisphaera corsica]